MSTLTEAQPRNRRVTRRRTLRAVSIASSVLADVAIWIIAVAAVGIHLDVDIGSGITPIGLISVIAATVTVGLLAWALLAVLERSTRHATAIWTTIAVVFAALSLGSPIGLAQNGQATTTLVFLHVVAAVLVITGFRLSVRGSEKPSDGTPMTNSRLSPRKNPR